MNSRSITKQITIWLMLITLLLSLTSCTTAKYEKANKLMQEGKYTEAAQIYSDLGVYEDATKMAIYAKAAAAGENGDYFTCLNGFTSLGNFKDSPERLAYYTARQCEAQAAAAGDAAAACSLYAEALRTYAALPQYLDADARDAACLQAMYDLPATLAAEGDYAGAAAAMSAFTNFMDQERGGVGIYADAPVWVQYYTACQYETAGDYIPAADLFASLASFQDAAQRSEILYQSAYTAAEAALEEGNPFAAWELFSAMPQYRDSLERSKESRYLYGETLLDGGDYTGAQQVFTSLGDYKDASTRYADYWYTKGEDLLFAAQPDYEGAKAAFIEAGDYSDASQRAAYGCDYQKAKDLMAAGDYAGAYQLLLLLNGYADVDTLLSTDENLLAAAKAARDERIAPFRNVGQYVLFGSYEQDNDLQNGAEPIEWRVLHYDEDAQEVLLISRYALHNLPYHTPNNWEWNDEDIPVWPERGFPTWAGSNIRAWLNDEFLNTAFTTEEQNAIAEAALSTKHGRSAKYNTDTVDKVFLLSMDEVELYLPDNSDRKAAPTAYAVAMGAYQFEDCTVDGVGCSNWWLRSYTTDIYTGFPNVYYVGLVGYISETYMIYDNPIRPAIKLDLSAVYSTTGTPADATANESASADNESDLPAAPANASTSDNTKPAAEEVIDAAAPAPESTAPAVGSYITFGHYPQTAEGNDNTPIEWLVVARDGNKVLLISRYALDCQPYQKSNSAITWEECSLRTWLNDTFINKAFNSQEQTGILTTHVQAHKNPEYSTNPGGGTQDKIFLLSITEAETYFQSDEARVCKLTDYAVKQGSYEKILDTTMGNCWWWLRSPGCNQDSAANVIYLGSVNRIGNPVINNGNAVRPALWIDLDSGIF